MDWIIFIVIGVILAYYIEKNNDKKQEGIWQLEEKLDELEEKLDDAKEFPSLSAQEIKEAKMQRDMLNDSMSISRKVDIRNHQGNEIILKKKTVKKQPVILIIDDDPFLLRMYDLKFSKAGFNVQTLQTAVGDLVQEVINLEPDIIVSDIIRPGRDGFETLLLLKGDERTKQIPIVMLTNQSNKIDIDKAMRLGAADYIIKAQNTPAKVVEKVKEIYLAIVKDVAK